MRLEQCSVINSIAYRGDTRRPREIFTNGLWNRQTPEAQWLKVLSGGGGAVDADLDLDIDGDINVSHLTLDQQGKINDSDVPKACEPFVPGKLTYRLWVKSEPAIYITFRLRTVDGIRRELWDHYIQNVPFYREDKNDISPTTAVCLTLRPHVSPYFPIEGTTDPDGEWIWIYVVILGAAYKTYTVQTKRGSLLARAQEVAVEHVSPQHILCALRCWRKGKYPTVKFVMTPRIIWNPVAGGERMLCKNDILKALAPYHGMKTTCNYCEVTKSVRDSARLFLEPKYPYWVWNK